MSRQDWRTPPSLFAQLDSDFGPFDLDAAADDKNHLCKRYWTENDNALARTWAVLPGCAWFVNIPFGDPGPWIEKAIQEQRAGHRGVVICLGQLSAFWFHQAWANASLLIPDRRINYWHPDENPVGRGFDRDSVIFSFSTHRTGHTAHPYAVPSHSQEVRRLYAEANGQGSLLVSA